MHTEIKKLNRFTTLPILLDYLEREKLVLLNPLDKWDDKNDTLIIETYKQKANIEKLFALCFTHRSETIHHWKTFANGSSGCCIEFDGKKIIDIFNKDNNLRHDIVRYYRISNAKSTQIKLADIPFTKRYPYRAEKEYRVIYEGNIGDVYEIKVPIEVIRRVTFSQQLPEQVYKTIKSLLINKYPKLSKKIFRSTVYENQTWIKNFNYPNPS